MKRRRERRGARALDARKGVGDNWRTSVRGVARDQRGGRMGAAGIRRDTTLSLDDCAPETPVVFVNGCNHWSGLGDKGVIVGRLLVFNFVSVSAGVFDEGVLMERCLVSLLHPMPAGVRVTGGGGGGGDWSAGVGAGNEDGSGGDADMGSVLTNRQGWKKFLD